MNPNSTTKLDRHVEDLAVTTWWLVEVRSNGIVLRDGPSEDRWPEETFWTPGSRRAAPTLSSGREGNTSFGTSLPSGIPTPSTAGTPPGCTAGRRRPEPAREGKGAS